VSARGFVGLGFVLGLGFAACRSSGRTHCADADGDATCAAHHPDGSRPYCVRGACAPQSSDGCVAAPPTDPTCALPCGGDTDGMCATDGGTSSSSGMGTDSTSSSSGPASTTMIADDTSSSPGSSSSTTGPATCDVCPAEQPICVDGNCTPCDVLEDPQGACTAIDPDRPLCVAGMCGQCSELDTTHCTGTVPVCDEITFTCVACTAHEQCSASACLLGEGSCLPPDRVWYVDGDNASCGSADGTPAAPYCTIAEGLAQIGQAQRGTIRVAASGGPYSETFEIGANRIVAILPTGANDVVVITGSGVPTFALENSTLVVERLRLQGNGQAPAIEASNSGVWLDRMEIVQNQGGGISLGDASELHARNSVIGAGGTALGERHAVYADGSTFDLLYTTIAGNDGTLAPSIRCVSGGAGTVRNSAVIGLDAPSISCIGIAVDTSVIDTMGLGGMGNVEVDMWNGGWFLDAAGGDFRVTRGTLLDDVAIWTLGDPPLDLEGAARPATDGALDVAGADRP
jgi:hypothetical protein